jgi:hypothetical protein
MTILHSLRSSRNQALVALGIALAAYAVLLWLNKWISDDGYIYLAYVQNVFDHGELAFNLGERVDAATGFVWLVALIFAKGILFFLDERQVAFILSWACCLGAYVLLARLVRAGETRFLIALAALLFTPFIVSFSTSGLETPLILLVSVWIYTLGRDHFRSTKMAVILGVAPFIRPELGILLVLYWCFMLRQRSGRLIAVGLITALVLAAARWLCFGSVIPNTAFVKLLSSTFRQGYWYLYEFAASYWYLDVVFACSALIAVWLLFRLVRHRRLPEGVSEHHVFIIASTALLVAYIYKSGGDFMHGRFFLTPVVFVVLLVVDLAPAVVKVSLGRWSFAATISISIAVGAVAHTSESYASREHDNWYRKIADEQVGSTTRNPSLNAWSGENLHAWAVKGRRLNWLTKSVGRKVGVVASGVGQIGYYADASEVYIFDRLALTSMVGSFLDIRDHFRRTGHSVLLPGPLEVLDRRLTLFDPPDDQLTNILRFRFEKRPFVLGALSDLDAYIDAKLLGGDTWQRVDARVSELLQAPLVDRNAVFYLRHRYPSARPLFAEISRIHDELSADPVRSWSRWYEQHRELIDELEAIQRGERDALPGRYSLYLAEGRLKPIETTYQRSSWAVRVGRSCAVNLSKAPVLFDDGVTASWAEDESTVTFENSRGSQATAKIDLQSAVEQQCGAGTKTLILDWVVRAIDKVPGSYFWVDPPLSGMQRFYEPGPQILVPLDPTPGNRAQLTIPVAARQTQVLWISAIATEATR